MQKKVYPSPTFSTLKILHYVVLIAVVFYFGKTLLIPLSFSLLISFLLFPVCKWLENKGLSSGIAIFLSLFGILLFLVILMYLLFTQIIAFSNEWEPFKEKLLQTVNDISYFLTEQLGVSSEKQSDYFKNSINNSGSELLLFLKNIAYSFSESLFFLLIIPVFSALILFHRQLMIHALFEIFPEDKKNMILEILTETIHAYYNFIKGMAVVYLIVGLLNSIGLAIIGIPHPFLFGFMASILTFIPYVGIMISSLLPIAISWITFNSIWYPVGVIVVFSLVQILEAYVIFPFAVGNRLKINTLVIIVMVIIGGILWGAAGMILFIPFTSIMKLIADRTPGLKTISMLLGEGHIENTKP
jgi:predicted PurR-regulated permease PerM